MEVIMEKGIEQTKEVLAGLLVLSALLAEKFKDGVQIADFAQIMQAIQDDEVLKAKLIAAYEGVEQVPAEMKDLSLSEAFDLLTAIFPEILDLIDAVRK